MAADSQFISTWTETVTPNPAASPRSGLLWKAPLSAACPRMSVQWTSYYPNPRTVQTPPPALPSQGHTTPSWDPWPRTHCAASIGASLLMGGKADATPG